ncbi:unnamed protein product [Paramecium pentaurelia]|uniref:Transmembrane protein n=1 Tax=Paramecium pentaurelia TaxID=43138 RepID=A0A8S1X9W8_9CILI|nr:unnamed protein product [Paramecium pentaurelia]
MQQLQKEENKGKKTEPSQIFQSLLFLIATSIIESNYIDQECNQNLSSFIHLVFYGFICFTITMLTSAIPRSENKMIDIIFAILSLCFYIYQFSLWIYALTLYSSENDCQNKAPVLYFFLEMYVVYYAAILGIIIFAIIFFSVKALLENCFKSKKNIYLET